MARVHQKARGKGIPLALPARRRIQSRAVQVRFKDPGTLISHVSYKAVARVFVLAIVGTHAFFLWSVRDRIARADPDFTSFYSAGKIVRDGRGAELYDFGTQQKAQDEFSSNADIRKGPLPYIHPPYEALLFVPLTFVPYTVAFTVWECLNLLFLCVICWLLRKDLASFQNLSTWQLVVLCLAFFPVLANFHQGQDAILLLLIVVVAFRNIERGEEFAGGCWLGLGIFKYHLVLPLTLILVLWKGRRLLLGFAGVASAAVIASLAIVGWRGAMRYPAFAWQVVSEPRFGGLPFRRMPDLLGLVGGWPITERIGWPVQIAVITASVALAMITVRLRPRSMNREIFRQCFSCAVILAVLLGYCTNTYDLCLLILPLALLTDYWVSRPTENLWSRATSIFPAAVICLSPLWFFLWMRWERINLMALFLLWWFFALRNEVMGVRTKRESARRPALI